MRDLVVLTLKASGTYVPIDEALNIIRQKLGEDETLLEWTEFLWMVTIIVLSKKLKDGFYAYDDGLPLGSSRYGGCENSLNLILRVRFKEFSIIRALMPLVWCKTRLQGSLTRNYLV